MQRRVLLALAAACGIGTAAAAPSAPFKIGFILPMTGQSASTGKQIEGAIKLWIAQNGSTVAGRKVEVIVKDDAGVADKSAGGGEALLAAMKGQVFESPRGQILIDAQTRDIVQDVYIRKVERVAAMRNQLYNVEFDVQKAVKDPAKVK